MSNLKRIQLTSVGPPEKEKKPKKKAKTFRFELSLGESNAVTCPEYSFTELIRNEKTTASDDPFNDDDADAAEVAAIAQRFEAKYGPKSAYSGKKKRTREMDDYYDLGDGYDIDDPFIDNTEAYDEVVPSTLTTKHGGFYINQGQLDFRSLSEDSFQAFLSPEKILTGKKKKKRNVLNSDSEEETGESLTKKFKAMKKKKLLESKALEKKRKKLSDGTDREPLIKKKKKKNPQKLMKKLSRLRETYGVSPSPASSNQTSTPTSTATPIASTTASAISTMANSNAVHTTAQQLPQSTVETVSTIMTPTVTTSTTSTTSAGQTVANGVESGVPSGLNSEGAVQETPGTVISETMREESSSKSGDEGRGEQQSGDKITQLPAQLPPDMLNSIESLKKCAKESTEGKCKFFSPEVNKLLLEIEIGSYALAWGSRTAIFGHLGDHLPCGKPALLRRAKKLHETQEDDLLQKPTQRLKKAISEVMPALQEQYRQELQKAKAEAEKSNSTEGPKEEATTESEEDETKQETTAKKFKRPKRIFPWTKETRQCLENIVVLKMKSHKIFKSRNQTAVDYIKAFLDSSVRPLWPQGWMQTRILMKESRMSHEELAKTVTAQPSKDKVLPPSGKPWPSATPDISTNTVVSTASRPPSQPHVSKTEDVVEISGRQSQQELDRATNLNKTPGSRDVAGGGGGDTIVVDLPGSSPSTAPSARPPGPSSSTPKLPLPPVEVIDITDSPLKPSLAQSTISPSLPGGDKISTAQKQSQQSQPAKPVSKLQLHPSHQWNRQPRMSQPTQNPQPSARSVSTLAAPALSQPSASQAKPEEALSSLRGSNLDSIYQAKVILKPVSVTQGQHKVGGSAKMLNHSITGSVLNTKSNASSKPGTVQQQGQPKLALPTNSVQQLGPSKPPASFSQMSPLSVTSGQRGQDSSAASVSSTKLYSHIPQYKKSLVSSAANVSGNSSIASPQTGAFPRTSNQQVRSGVVLGTSSSHANVHFSHSQAGVTKTSNLISYRPQQIPGGLSSGQPARPDKALQGTPGSTRLLQTAGGSPGSSKLPHDQARKQAAIRTLQLQASAQASSGSPLRPATHLGIQTTSPSPPKRTYQPEQPSPPSRGSDSCSPQQLSPGEAGAKLTLYEQIQMQIRSQEAMEGQALKNLALARNFTDFTGPKKSVRPNASASIPVSSHTSRAGIDSTRLPGDKMGLSHLHSAVPDMSPNKLQENLLKLRDTMGGKTAVRKHPASMTSPGLASQPQDAWQLPQPGMSIKSGSKLNSSAIKVSTPMVEPQQSPSARNEKNIFSEMQKSGYDVESFIHAKKSSLYKSAVGVAKDSRHLVSGGEITNLCRDLSVDKVYNTSRSKVMTSQHSDTDSVASLYRARNLAKSILEEKTVVGSKYVAGGDASSVTQQLERKSYPWPDKSNPDKVPGSPSHFHHTKGQGNSGLSSQ